MFAKTGVADLFNDIKYILNKMKIGLSLGCREFLALQMPRGRWGLRGKMAVCSFAGYFFLETLVNSRVALSHG